MTYNILVYSDKHLSVHVVVAHAKLKLSNELEHECTYLRNDIQYKHIIHIDRSQGKHFHKCEARSGSPQLLKFDV